MELLEIPVPSGTTQAHVSRPASGSGPGVLFFMDAIGVRPQIVATCDRIASWGYVVVAPNVFHREGDVDAVGPHVDLREPGAREEFFEVAMPPEAVATLGATLAQQDLSFTNDVYPDAPHGYTMADTAMYQEAGAERHFDALQALFARTL